MIKYPVIIPQYNLESNEWTEREFLTKRDFLSFVEGKYKLPGQYNLKRTDLWRQPAINFQTNKVYCNYHEQSEDFKNWWKFEKTKTKNGVIYNIGTDEFYVTGDYYWYLNFIQIDDQLLGREEFPEVWDSDYHFFLYVIRCELYNKNSCVVKKRRSGYSLKHVAMLMKDLWFVKNSVSKMIAYEEDAVSGKNGSWKFVEAYRNFLNTNTPWYRSFDPDEKLNWKQQQVVVEGDIHTRKVYKGLMSTITAATCKKDVAKAVGGKCHPAGTKIWTTTGLKNVEDIKIGEFVFGKDGKPKKVLETHTGYGDIYKIKQNQGKDYCVSEGHLLYLYTSDHRLSNKCRTYTVEEVIELKKKNNSYSERLSCIKVNTPLQFPEKNISLDPYFLGLWLGDGYKAKPTIIVNKTKDKEIFNYLTELSKDYPCTVTRKEEERYNDEMYTFNFSLSERRGINSKIVNEFVKYNLFYNKHVPDDYLYNSPDVRAKLFAGLVDTDGTLSKNYFSVCSSDKVFLESFQKLITSLGIYSSIRKITSKGHYTKGNSIKESDSYILTLGKNVQFEIPTKIERKKQSLPESRRQYTSRFEIEYIGKDNYYGFECEDHLYVLEDGTLTHNSTKIFWEESGKNPRLDDGIGYANDTAKLGSVKTGMQFVSGAVGELKDCKPLEKYALDPETNGFLGVDDMFSENPQGKICFFVPDYWNYLGYEEEEGKIIKCYDEDGNSDIELAKTYILREDAEAKKQGESEYRLWKSQHPWSLQDAFAIREENPFPVDLIKEHQTLLIQNYKPLTVEIKKEEGKLKTHFIEGFPVRTLKVDPNKDNRGCIEIFELPVNNPPWGLYYAGIDPIAAKNTSTSKSLQSVTIYKAVHYVGEKLVMDYPVAQYTGRHPKWEDTYRTSLDLMHLYNTRTCVENNISDFIEWCIKQGESKYLMRRKEVTMLNEMVPNSTIRDEIGVRMEGEFKKKALRFLETYVDEIIGTEFEEDGTSHYIYGVTRIKDIMLLEELLKFNPRQNVDRVISAMLALLAARSNTNRNIIVETKSQDYRPKPKPSLIIPSQFQQRPVGQGGQRLILPNQFKRK